MRGLEELNLYVRSRNKPFDFSALLLWSVLWACGAQAQTPDTGKAHVWDTYVHARFAYSVCYPGDVLLPQGEADNGDGQKFITKDGKAEARVYGSYFASNGEDQSLKKTYLDEIQSVQKNGFTVTYKLQAGIKNRNSPALVANAKTVEAGHPRLLITLPRVCDALGLRRRTWPQRARASFGESTPTLR